MPLGAFVKRNGLELAVITGAIAALALANYLILRPFLPAILWAVILVTSTWPIFGRLHRLFAPRRTVAVTVMVLLLVAVVAVPSTVLIASVVQSAPAAFDTARQALASGLPPLPAWAIQLPLVGPRIDSQWQDWTAHPDHLVTMVEPYGQQIFSWLTGSASSVGRALINLLLTLIFSAALYMYGDAMLISIRHWARRFGGTQADQLLQLVGNTLRGVTLGVVGTALIQSLLAAVSFAVSGIEHVAILFVLTLSSALVQLGAAPVVALVALWHYLNGNLTWAIALAIWTVIVGGLDNVLRPLLIRQGVDLPMWLIFAGVIGGLLAFGIAGLFVGPVVLALTHRIAYAARSQRPHTDAVS